MASRALHRGTNLWLTLVFIAGCSEGRDLPPLTQEGDKVMVGTAIGLEVCAGDLARLDAQVRYVEQVLDVELDDKIPVYVYSEPPSDCDDLSGCYFYDEAIVLGVWSALDHELVHAVVDRLERPTDFWNEGLAEALRPRATRQGDDGVLESLDRPSRDLDYRTAGHFVRWLHLGDGADGLRALVRGVSFEAAYDGSVGSFAQEFDAAAPWSYPSRAPCDAPALPGSDGHWTDTASVDCSAGDSSRFGGEGVSTSRSLRVESAGVYRVEQQGGTGVRMIRCETAPVATMPTTQCYQTEDVPCETDRSSLAGFFAAGSPHDLELPTGDYLLTMSTAEGVERDTITISVDELP